MPSKGPQFVVCLICLQKFKMEGSPDNQPYRNRLLKSHRGYFDDSQKVLGRPHDLYTRFLHFTGRYLTLKEITAPLVENLKGDNDGEGGRVELFCGSCKELVSYVCDLYAELQIVRLHLDWKLSQLGGKLRKLGSTSEKYRRGLERSVAGRLRVTEITKLKTFRKTLEDKCIGMGNDNFPRPLIPRGLLPEEWTHPFSETKTILKSLIVVFLLASPIMYMKRENTTVLEDEDMTLRKKQGSRRGRPLRPRAPKWKSHVNNRKFIKQELNTAMENAGDVEDEYEDFTNCGNNDDVDSDWSNSNGEAAPPTTPRDNNSNAFNSDFIPSRENCADQQNSRITSKPKIAKNYAKTESPNKKKFPSKIGHLDKTRRRRKNKAMENVKKRKISMHTCTICNQKILGIRGMHRHLNTAHETEEKLHHCWFCPKKFTLLQTVDFHRLYSHKRYMFQCENSFCSETFLELEKYEEHLKKHLSEMWGKDTSKEKGVNQQNHEGDTKLESAEETSKQMESSLNDATDFPEVSHAQVVLSTTEETSSMAPPPSEAPLNSLNDNIPNMIMLHCSKCNWCFLDPDLLKLHEMIHMKPKKEGDFYQCPKCLTFHASLKELHFHYDGSHVKTNVPLYECPECEITLLTKRSWITHMDRHKRKNELGANAPICQECGFLARTPTHLKEHSKRHDEKNLISCPENGCERKFLRSSLAAHITKCHKTEKKYRCPYGCGACFARRYSVTQHVYSVHGNQTFICDICGAKFKRIYAMRHHKEEKHNPNGQTKYICSECGMSFKTLQGLNFHIGSVHTPNSERRYGCPYCPKRYHRKQVLNLHVKTCVKINGSVTAHSINSLVEGENEEMKVKKFIPETSAIEATMDLF